MLNMGFIRDIERIISKVTKPHNTILISATLSDEVKNISKKYQKDPIFFKTQVSEKNTPKIDQHFIKINEHNKLDAIKKLLQDNNFYLTIIFTNTK
jgi:ATP-dependent RNA helicase DeaD